MQTNDTRSRFRDAHDDGEIGAEALAALTVEDIGANIQAGLGITPDEVPASEVVLLTLLLDDSSSIAQAGTEGAVRHGHNAVLRAVAGSRQSEGVLVHTRYLNRGTLFPFRRLADAEQLDGSNYRAIGGTPLYDQSAATLGTVILKTREFADAGVPARSITLIVTDGEDVGSREQTARSVAAIVKDILRQESHIVAAMGIGDGSRAMEDRFRSVFREMGIPDEWVLTPGNSEAEIRRAFNVFSQSAVRASQSTAGFGQASLGGFGA